MRREGHYLKSYNSLPWGGDKSDVCIKESAAGLADIDYTPEKLRQQCESLHMRLSQDFPTPLKGGSGTLFEHNETAVSNACAKQIARAASRNNPAGSIEVFHPIGDYELIPNPATYDRTVLSLENKCLPSDAGLGQNPAFHADQPATLPRPGRSLDPSEVFPPQTDPNSKYDRGVGPTRRWTIMDRTPKVMRVVTNVASRVMRTGVTSRGGQSSLGWYCR